MRSLSLHVRRYTTKPGIGKKASQQSCKRQRYLELSNLPPLPPGTTKHVSTNRTAPASASPMIFHTPAPGGFLNPEYKLIKGGNRYLRCPSSNNRLFSAKLIPYELLSHVEPDQLPPFPASPSSQFTGFGPEGDKIRYRSKMNKRNTIYASLFIIPSKEKVHDHAIIRRTSVRRIREAFKLIIIRGARASEDGESIVFSAEDTGEERWLVKGWSYVIFPTLEAYRVPWPSLIATVRESLIKLKTLVGNLSDETTDHRHSDLRNSKSDSSRGPVKSTEPSGNLIAKRQRGPSGNRQLSGRGAQKGHDKNLKHQNPPSTRSYSTKVSRAVYPGKVDMRAEVVLGTLGRSWDLKDLREAEALESSYWVIPPRLEDVEVETIHYGDEGNGLLDAKDARSFHAEIHEEDAEGWVLAGDRLPEDEYHLSTPHLFGPSNILRFFPPHLPHHAGRGYEKYLLTTWKHEKRKVIRDKYADAVEDRRKRRKRLRERWNHISIAWIRMLRRREEKRLENMYGWVLDQERDANATNRPWWAPNFRDLGWDHRADIRPQEWDLGPVGDLADAEIREEFATGSDELREDENSTWPNRAQRGED